MINEMCEAFEKEYKEKGSDLITDNYTLAPGDYIFFNLNDTAENIKIFNVNKKTDKNQDDYKKFAKVDSISTLISMNKPIDPNKVIHSNNIYSFFVKKDNLNPESGKLGEKVIDDYYNTLKNPKEKYKKKPKSLELYLKAEEKYGETDTELIDKISNWIKNNIKNISTRLKLDKTYLKIFYVTDLKQYEAESEKYILPNIYNSTDYNLKINKKVYGLPDFNMGLNSKKPFLENKTRKIKIPVLVNSNRIALEKKLFDYLLNYSAEGKNYIYFNNKEISPINSRENIKSEFNGHFLRVNKGKEVEIIDYDSITSYNYKFKKKVSIVPIVENDIGKDFLPEKCHIDDISVLKNKVDEIFFNKFLINNFFTEAKDIRLNEIKVKESLLRYRHGFFTWFYKGEDTEVRNFWDRMSMNLLCNSLNHGYINKAINQFNFRHAMLNYFKCENGGDNMEVKISDIRKSVDRKINIKDDKNYEVEINSNAEYYFCIGQLLQFFYSLNKSGSKNLSFINSIISAKNDKFIKEKLIRLFCKYNYAISQSFRFNNMYYMVEAYKGNDDVDKDCVVAGFLCPNLIYKKEK